MQKDKEDKMPDEKKLLTRRTFIKIAAGTGAGVLLSGCESELFTFLEPKTAGAAESPLTTYPNRDWEKVYRNVYEEDSHF
ncbi:MAG: twin-arginine translocation signal domain-containing protein, partial [Desulfobacterales bacterium]|nr:twin-arginine translocation signal domain-containing protein [Desulfobacterales bacterium]